MAIDTKKISLPKTASDIKLKTIEDQLVAIYKNADGEMIQKILPGNVNKEEEKMIKVGEKTYKITDGKVTEVGIASPNPIKRGKQKSKANPGDAGGSTVAKLAKGGFPDLSGDGKVTQKDILMGKGVIKMKKGGIVKKKSSRTRIAKRGFGIAKRGY
tara:strand:- start:5 stop:475 length:471 start_codon:yes stop_codon:yes gene_type:complete